MSKPTGKAKECFYCGKRHLSWDKKSIDYVINHMTLCEACQSIIRVRFGLEEKILREPGEEG